MEKSTIENFKTESVKQKILEIITKEAPIARKTLIRKVIELYKLETPTANTFVDSEINLYKAEIGQVLSKMFLDKEIDINFEKKLVLKKNPIEIAVEDKFNNFLIELFESRKKLTKQEIFKLCEEKFAVAAENRTKIRSLLGNLIIKLVKNNRIFKSEGTYTICENEKFPNTDIGNCLSEADKSDNLYDYFIKAINIKGGEFFEYYSVKLLEKYFKKNNHKIEHCSITGGSNDNGIDGKIELTDDLGYKDKILIQCKVRLKSQVTLKEVREFYGALVSEKGTKGIFMTNNSYHYEAKKFINKNYNLIGIDNIKLFELAKKYAVGIIKENNKYRLDANLFLGLLS